VLICVAEEALQWRGPRLSVVRLDLERLLHLARGKVRSAGLLGYFSLDRDSDGDGLD